MASSLTRTVIGIVSIGAGVVTVGIATSLSPLPATLMVLAALAQLAYGIAVMMGLSLRGYGIALELVPSAIFALTLLLTPSSIKGDLLTAAALGSALNVVGALLVAAGLSAGWAKREPRRGWAFLVVAALSAGIVGGVATPALAATEAGTHAAKHGGMAGMSGMGGMEGHAH